MVSSFIVFKTIGNNQFKLELSYNINKLTLVDVDTKKVYPEWLTVEEANKFISNGDWTIVSSPETSPTIQLYPLN